MGFITDLFGKNVQLPEWQQLDLGTEQKKAISGNVASLPAAEALTTSANTFSIDEINRMLSSTIPGYSGIASDVSKNISSWLKGVIPTDEADRIQNLTASRTMGRGTAGSGMANAELGRNYGLSTLDLVSKGITSAQSWISQMASIYEPAMMNVSSMFVTPTQQATFDTNERDTKWQYDYLAAQMQAMPDATLTGIVRNIGATIKGAMGGMGSMGGGSGSSGGSSSGGSFG